MQRANRHLNSARGDGDGKKGQVFPLSENRCQKTWQDKELGKSCRQQQMSESTESHATLAAT